MLQFLSITIFSLYGDALGGQPWQARLWADDTLKNAVAHGVLTPVDRRRAKLAQPRLAHG